MGEPAKAPEPEGRRRGPERAPEIDDGPPDPARGSEVDGRRADPGEGRGQGDVTTAEVYEEIFVPALFRRTAERLLAEAQISHGERVLDLGCGTGIVARLAADRVGASGSVTGLEPNEAMLAVARRIAPQVDWRPGNALTLPFEDGAFDRVLSQAILTSFQEPEGALQEMFRVVRPTGRVVVLLWDALERNPAFLTLVEAAGDRFGDEVASLLGAPFSLGEPERLLETFRRSGGRRVGIRNVRVVARFPSVRSWLYMQLKGSSMGSILDERGAEALLDGLEPRFAWLAAEDGTARIPISTHLVTAHPPEASDLDGLGTGPEHPHPGRRP